MLRKQRPGTRIGHLSDQPQRRSDTIVTVAVPLQRQRAEYSLHRRDIVPAGKGIVGDVDEAARVEMRVDEINDMPLVLRADPGPNAVQGDIMETR